MWVAHLMRPASVELSFTFRTLAFPPCVPTRGDDLYSASLVGQVPASTQITRCVGKIVVYRKCGVVWSFIAPAQGFVLHCLRAAGIGQLALAAVCWRNHGQTWRWRPDACTRFSSPSFTAHRWTEAAPRLLDGKSAGLRLPLLRRTGDVVKMKAVGFSSGYRYR